MLKKNKSLALYKEIVDGLTKLSKGVHRVWVKERGWPDLPENKNINEFIERLSDSDKDILVQLLEQARHSGIHDTLVYINDRMAINGLEFVEEGVKMSFQPFDTELYYDWVCRSEGDSWPDEKI